MINENEIGELHTSFMALIGADSRSSKLVSMYDDFGNELVEAPASSRTHYHSAYTGGYIEHVMNVYDASVKVATLYKSMKGVIDFTKQELVFAALHHDLGKLGNPNEPYYTNQDSDWHRKRGEMYKLNENMQFMAVTDRALFLLQKYEITITEKEYLAIKLSDGLYESSNESYLKNPKPNPMKTNLPHIIHWADHMACAMEHDLNKK